jgi:hypothetical protein
MTSYRPRISVGPLQVILMFSILFAGCAGMTPYEPHNSREEGPEKGLFSGSQGEFVILRKMETDKKDQSEEKADPHDE